MANLEEGISPSLLMLQYLLAVDGILGSYREVEHSRAAAEVRASVEDTFCRPLA